LSCTLERIHSMRLFVEFDVSADIIDVPESVIRNKEHLHREFLKWLTNKQNKHKYWVTVQGHRGLCYRSDAFVEWLNDNYLKDSKEKAVIVQQYVSIKNEQKLPSVFSESDR